MSTLNLALELFMWKLSIKFYHWNTTVYARHVATCGLGNTLDEAIDSIIEKYIARYGRPTMSDVSSVPILPLNDADALAAMKKMAIWLQKEFPKYVKASDTDLLNLRDDLLGHVQNTIYLFSFE
jgi:hypothetical protein